MPLTSWATFERPAELIQVVVIVRGKAGDPVGKGQATAAEMDSSSLPLRRRQGSQERQHLGSAPVKCDERLTGVVTEILTFLSPTPGIERVANGATDPPSRQLFLARSQDKDARLLECHDRVEPDLEELLDISEVADDFLGRPVLGVGAPGKFGVRLARNCPL